MSYRKTFTILVSLAAVGLFAGCSSLAGSRTAPNSPNAGTMIVTLFDESVSTAGDAAIYRGFAETILLGVHDGDRVVFAPITASSGADFRSMKEVIIADPLVPEGLFDEPTKRKAAERDHAEQLKQKKAELRAGLDDILAVRHGASHTAVFESIRTVVPLFASETKRHKVLVVLSDMVEDSEIANFTDRVLTAKFVDTELERQRNQGILPDLRGVSICAAGVLSSPPAKAAAQERFWTSYFTAAGAIVQPGWYSRVISSCAASRGESSNQ